MKNKKFLILPLLALVLTSCSFNPFDLLSQFLGGDDSYPSYEEGSYSVDINESASVISKNESYTPKKENINYTYKDIMEHNLYATDAMPTEGDVNVLVIPVWFSESGDHISTNSTSYSKKTKDEVRQDIRNAFFGDENEDNVSWRSVKSYYKEASFGKLNINGVVTGWYNTNNSVSRYNNANATIELLKNAVNWAKNSYSSTLDFTKYDVDKNGYLDCVCLIYGYHNSNYKEGFNMWSRPSKGNDNLWAYTFWAQDKSLQDRLDPGVNTFLWASYDFMYAEYGGGSNTETGKIDAHTYIHEMGHCMGLEDYYDYSGSNCPAGGFSMQDYNIGGHDPYSRMALGWINPYVPTGDCDITISDFESSGDIIVLSPNFVNSPFDEYLILELYTDNGLNGFDTANAWTNAYPQGSNIPGIRLWHVDSRLLEYKTYPRAEDEGYEIARTISNRSYYKLGLSNTKYTPSTVDYCSVCPGLRDFSLLYLVRNSKTTSYPAGDKAFFKAADLFLQNDKFTMADYSKQFVNGSKFDNGLTLPFEFTVKSLSDNSATISIKYSA